MFKVQVTNIIHTAVITMTLFIQHSIHGVSVNHKYAKLPLAKSSINKFTKTMCS